MSDIRLRLPIGGYLSDKSSDKYIYRKPNLPTFQIQLRDLLINHAWIGLDEVKSSFMRASRDWSHL